MDIPLPSLADPTPLAATLLVDTLLEQTWHASTPETWFAAPLILALSCALAWTKGSPSGCEGPGILDRMGEIIRAQGRAPEVIRAALGEMRALTRARAVLVAIDAGAAPPLLFEYPTSGPAARTVGVHEHATYFFDDAPAAAPDTVAVFDMSAEAAPPAFVKAHPFAGMAGIAFRIHTYNGRLFVLDPEIEQTGQAPRLRDLERPLCELLPAVARICELHARRHHAEASERARIGRELHDGVVQELACLDMELELIREHAVPHAGLGERIGRVQDRLRAELSNIRTLVQQARCYDVDASRLPAVLESMVARFERDARVRAVYVSEVSEVRLPPQVCGEIARIVQEALVNVRRHSGARRVVVTFSCDRADWKLSIQDDGRGFTTPARAGKKRTSMLPPAIIHDRVHSLGGTVRVIAPGRAGARLEISAAQRDEWKRTV